MSSSIPYLTLAPFVISTAIEALSPVITRRVSNVLDRYMEELDDDQLGNTAKKEIGAFSQYAFDMFQAYTALVLTFVSGAVQILSTDSTGLLSLVLLASVFVVAAALLYDKVYIGDPMTYQSFTKKWRLSPVSWTAVSLNIVIILLVLI